MKIIIVILFFVTQYNLLIAQSVGIGTSTPNSSALLDVASSDKGFLLPLLSQSQRIAIANPAEGLLVYDTTHQRFYQFQDGTWRFIINSEYWSTSTNLKYLYNIADSIGIGTFLPQKKLDVGGDIHSGNNINADASIVVDGTAVGGTLFATGALSAGGNLTVSNNINGNGQLIVDAPAATVQFKNAGVNKTFYQLSGDDLRLGTNTGNSTGNITVRMNGDNVLQVDGESNLTLIKALSRTTEHGKLVIGNRLNAFSSFSGNFNLLPVLYGRVLSDGYGPSMWPQTGESEKISTGVYEIDTHSTAITQYGIIVVTATGTSTPRICIGRNIGSGKFRVEIFNLAGNHIDNDFFFMINDPLN